MRRRHGLPHRPAEISIRHIAGHLLHPGTLEEQRILIGSGVKALHIERARAFMNVYGLDYYRATVHSTSTSRDCPSCKCCTWPCTLGRLRTCTDAPATDRAAVPATVPPSTGHRSVTCHV